MEEKMHHRYAYFALLALIGFGGFALAQAPWQELRYRPGANFYDIVKAHEAEKAAEEADQARDLTALLLQHPENYELEEDYHFNRWAHYVEPRVAPSGDMRLLDIGYGEILKRLPLDGRSPPAMRGEWEALGPNSSNTSGAGRLNWIAFHPTDKNTYMVGSPSGGLWFTTTSGQSWSTPTDAIVSLGAAWAAYHPTNPDIIYLATGDGDKSEAKSIGVLKSLDGGKTWNTTGLTFPISGDTQIHKLIIDPRNPEKLFVATSGGMDATTGSLQFSSDGGSTFRAATGISGKVWDVEMHPSNSDIVYASTTSLFVSNDGGATFAPVSGLPAAGYRMQIAVTAAQPDWVYVLRGDRSSAQGVHKSTNKGQSFTQTGNGSAIGGPFVWYAFPFDANPLNANDLMAGCMSQFRSTDGGASWSGMGSGWHVDIHSLTFAKDGTMYTLNDGGIWRSSNGTSWTNLNNNLSISQGYRIGVNKNDYDMICTGRQDNSTDIRVSAAGGFRRGPVGGDGFECFWNNNATRWYGESQNGAFEGCNFSGGQTSGCSGASSGLPAGIWDTPWGADPISPNTVYAGRQANMWKSTNNGGSWSQMGIMGGSGSIYNFAVAASDPNTIYAVKATVRGGGSGSGLFKTANGGSSWTSVLGSISGAPINVAVSDTDPNDVWVTITGYTEANKVFHSTNGGQAWTNETSTGLPNLPCLAIALDGLGQKGVYVGMDAGIYFKRNGMESWQNFSDRLPNAAIRELVIARKGSDSDRRLIASTYGRGVWRSRLWDDVSVGIRGAKGLPALRQFKTSFAGSVLSIQFQLGTDGIGEGASHIRLATMDGKVVHEESVPNSGVFERRVNLLGHGKGVYLFVLTNGKEQVSRRVAFQ